MSPGDGTLWAGGAFIISVAAEIDSSPANMVISTINYRLRKCLERNPWKMVIIGKR